MEECEIIGICSFFNGESGLSEEKTEESKNLYCRQNSLHCARFMVSNAVGNENVPDDLLPADKNRAYMLIVENS